jgi:phenylpropionate dioxygenase-like ring-hydroxylating dioxygenase large terminal subunit
LISTFQIIPLATEKTLIRMAVYGHPEATRSEKARCYLIDRISRDVGEEDRDFCRRVQRGLKTSDYRPGPLSQLEVCTAQFHEYLRERMAIVRERSRPTPEALREAARLAATEH